MTVKIGIIGTGAIARRAFLPGFAPPGSPQAAKAMPGFGFGGCEEAQVVGLVGRDQAKARALAEEFSVPKVYSDWWELVADDEIEAVGVTTPNYLHAKMTIAAARAGKHVLVEKPMATTMQEADEMVSAAEKAGVVLMVEQIHRFHPVHEVAKQIVEAGVLGRVLSVRSRFAHSGPEHWSPAGKWFFTKDEAVYGALFDLGIHKIDLIRFVTGKEVAEVSAFTGTLVKDIEVEDNAVCILRFTDGTLGVLEAGWTCSPMENSLQIYGEAGILKVGVERGCPISVEFATPPSIWLNTQAPPGTVSEALYLPEVPTSSQVGGPFAHFVRCIETGQEPIASGREGRASLEAILAAFRSEATGQVVRLPLPRTLGGTGSRS